MRWTLLSALLLTKFLLMIAPPGSVMLVIVYFKNCSRHSYAVAAIESGDDIKTVQSNLGHATASFTLDVYGHVSQKMRQQSAERMEQFIRKVSG